MNKDIIDIQGSGGKSGGGGGGGDESPNNLFSKAIAKIIFLIGEGEIQGLATGDARSVYLDEVPLQRDDGTFNFSGVSYIFRPGTPGQEYIDGFPAIETVVSKGTALLALTPQYTAQIPVTVDDASITIEVPALQQLNDDGNVVETSVQVEVAIKPAIGNYVIVDQIVINGKCSSSYNRTFKIVNLSQYGAGPWTVRVKRITADSSTIKISDQTNWPYYTEIINEKMEYPDCALFGCQIDAEQFGSNVPKVSFRMKGLKVAVPSNYNPALRTYMEPWNGSLKSTIHWTNNPAWIYYDLLTNDRYGLGLSGNLVDRYALYTIGKYCDEMVNDGYGGQEPRFTLNTVINSREDALNVINTVASCFRGMPLWTTGFATTVQDSYQDSTRLVTAANVIAGNFNYQGSAIRARYTVCLVTWFNPDDMHRTAIELVKDDNGIQRYGWRQKEIVAYGCTSRGQAHRMGRWTLFTDLYETDVVSYQAGWDHIDCLPGDIVSIADPHYVSSRNGGRIKAATTTQIQIDREVVLDAGNTYVVYVVLYDIVNQKSVVHERTLTNTLPQTTDVLTWSQALPSIPEVNGIWGLAGSVEVRRFRILGNREVSPGLFEITALLNHYQKYVWIDEDIQFDPDEVLPDYMDIPTGPIEPPTNLDIQEFSYNEGENHLFGVLVSWTHSTDPRKITYEIQIKPQHGSWEPIGERATSSFEYKPITAGNYYFRVRTKGMTSYSVWVEAVMVVISCDPQALGNITGLQVKGGGTIFSGKTCEIEWTAISSMTDGVGTVTKFKDYVVQILNASLQPLRTEFVTEPSYSYTYDKNLEDFGSPSRTIIFSVRARDIYFKQSQTPTGLIAENPAPDMGGLSPDITSLITGLKIDWSDIVPNDTDLEKFVVKCDTTSPPSTVIAEVGVGTTRWIESGLVALSTYYIQVIPWDVFGEGIGTDGDDSGDPLAFDPIDIELELVYNIEMSDSISTLEDTLRSLYDRNKTSGGITYSGNVWRWVQYRYAVEDIIDRVIFWLSGPMLCYVGYSSDGTTWKFLRANTTNTLTDNTLLVASSQSNAIAYPFQASAGRNFMKFPQMIAARHCRLFFYANGTTIHELIFNREVVAEQVTADNLSAISANIGVVAAGIIQSQNWGAAKGSFLDLNDEYLLLGGSVNPALQWDGNAETLNIRANVTFEESSSGYDNLVDIPNIPKDIDLLSYWGFNEGSGMEIVDQSGRGKTGLIVGSPIWTEGVAGRALGFTSNGLVRFNKDIISFDQNKNGSLCAWIYLTDSSKGMVIGGKSQGPRGEYPSYFSVYLNSANNLLYFQIQDVSALHTVEIGQGNPVPLNTWHHIYIGWSAINDEGVWKFTLHGAINAGVVNSHGGNIVNIVLPSQYIQIGGNGDVYSFSGKIDELRIYNRLLTDKERKGLYLYPTISNPTNQSWNQIEGTGKPVTFRVMSVGESSTSHPKDRGVYNNDNVLIAQSSGGYMVSIMNRTSMQWMSHTSYNTATSQNDAIAMANVLNVLSGNDIVIVHTYLDPKSNRLTGGLDNALYRCGASKAIFGSGNFKSQSAYILIGIGGIGSGNGLELYSGNTDNEIDAWVETTVQVINGNIQLGNISARDAMDISFTDGSTVEDYQPNQPGADVTGSNTALDTWTIDGIDASLIRIGAGVSFRNGFEATEFNDWYVNAVDGNTLVQDPDVFSGIRSGKFTSTKVSPVSSGVTDGSFIAIPIETALQFAGKRIRINLYAKQPSVNASLKFRVAYSVQSAGNSGWIDFVPTTSWQTFTFTYDVPAQGTTANVHYLGILGDFNATGKAVLIDNIVIGTVPKESELDALELINAPLDPGATSNLFYSGAVQPINGKGGDSWFDTANQIMYEHDGVSWKQVGTSNKTYYQENTPNPPGTKGDFWFIPSINTLHQHDGTDWKRAGTSNKTYFQNNSPAGTRGDFWFQPSTNLQFQHNGITWLLVGTRNQFFNQATTPQGSRGDTWFDTANQIMYEHDGVSWKQVGTSNRTYNQETTPPSGTKGDFWFQPSTGSLFQHNGTDWTRVGTRNNTYYQENTPPSGTKGDFWFKPSINTLYQHDGTDWKPTGTSNKTYFQNDTPAGTKGDFWFQPSTNSQFQHDGTTWQFVGTKNEFFNQATTPTGSKGDTWFDTANQIMYEHDGVSWKQIGTSNRTYNQETTPPSGTKGDFWFKPSISTLYQHNGTTWTQIGTNNNVYRQENTPTIGTKGDFWFQPSTNSMFQHDGTTWQFVGTKNEFFNQATTPTGSKGDSWFDTVNQIMYEHDGVSWKPTGTSNKTYFQNDTPAGTKGDFWFQPSTNSIFQHNGTTWQFVGTKNEFFNQATTPTGSKGDSWWNPTVGALYEHDGFSWKRIGVQIFRQATEPLNKIPGDIWYNTDTFITYRYNGTAWAIIANAYNNSNQLEDGAGWHNTTYSVPQNINGNPVLPAGTVLTVDDKWFNTTRNALYRWSGTVWFLISTNDVDWRHPSDVTTINGGKIRTGTITADQVTSGLLITNVAQIGTAVITRAHLNDAIVDTAQIANLAVETGKINNLAVTNAKIANLTVETGKIKDLAVTNAKIGNLQVDTFKIKDNAVTIPGNAYTAASMQLNTIYQPETTIQQLTLTTSGAPIMIFFSMILQTLIPLEAADDFESYLSSLKIYRNSNIIFTTPTNTKFYRTSYTNYHFPVYSLRVSIPAGQATYYVKATGKSVFVQKRNLFILEVLK